MMMRITVLCMVASLSQTAFAKRAWFGNWGNHAVELPIIDNLKQMLKTVGFPESKSVAIHDDLLKQEGENKLWKKQGKGYRLSKRGHVVYKYLLRKELVTILLQDPHVRENLKQETLDNLEKGSFHEWTVDPTITIGDENRKLLKSFTQNKHVIGYIESGNFTCQAKPHKQELDTSEMERLLEDVQSHSPRTRPVSPGSRRPRVDNTLLRSPKAHVNVNVSQNPSRRGSISQDGFYSDSTDSNTSVGTLYTVSNESSTNNEAHKRMRRNSFASDEILYGRDHYEEDRPVTPEAENPPVPDDKPDSELRNPLKDLVCDVEQLQSRVKASHAHKAYKEECYEERLRQLWAKQGRVMEKLQKNKIELIKSEKNPLKRVELFGAGMYRIATPLGVDTYKFAGADCDNIRLTLPKGIRVTLCDCQVLGDEIWLQVNYVDKATGWILYDKDAVKKI